MLSTSPLGLQISNSDSFRLKNTSRKQKWLQIFKNLKSILFIHTLFRSEPEKSDANSNSQNSEKFSFLASVKEYGSSIVRLMKSIPFLLLVVSYGLDFKQKNLLTSFQL